MATLAKMNRRPNRRLQLTAFGARDRRYFDTFRSAPRRQLKRSTFGFKRPVVPE